MIKVTKEMNELTTNLLDLSKEDVQSCIELACDGVTVHLKSTNTEQKAADVIHKVMYAITDVAQNNPAVVSELASNQTCQFRLRLQVLR